MSRLLVALALVTVASGLALAAQSLPAGAAASSGPSGLKWVGGNRGSQNMNPGMDCIVCHTKGEGPRFAAAGTVYTKIDEKDLEFGVEGAIVQITDAKGQVVKLTTNKAGNFFANRQTFAFPITAKVIYKDKTREMYSPQKTADCAACHQAKGVGGAPGRIMIP
jgi:mono/diheme cytochrome c family protein